MLALLGALRAELACKEGLYNYQGLVCVTTEECGKICENCRAYKALGLCVDAEHSGDTDPTKQSDGSYECENG